MSPLAVSQYLALEEDLDSLTFDTVIFDEASQVFPEDAVPAILRGKQVIFAGDQKQLPPSEAFRKGTEEGEYDEDDDLTDDVDGLWLQQTDVLANSSPPEFGVFVPRTDAHDGSQFVVVFGQLLQMVVRVITAQTNTGQHKNLPVIHSFATAEAPEPLEYDPGNAPPGLQRA